jgi:hypothetical protein
MGITRKRAIKRNSGRGRVGSKITWTEKIFTITYNLKVDITKHGNIQNK